MTMAPTWIDVFLSVIRDNQTAQVAINALTWAIQPMLHGDMRIHLPHGNRLALGDFQPNESAACQQPHFQAVGAKQVKRNRMKRGLAWTNLILI